MTSRETMLAKIRSARSLHGGAPTDSPSLAAAQAAWHSIPRGYEQAGTMTPEAKKQLFIDRLLDYDAVVLQCTEDTLAGTLLAALQDYGVTRLAVPLGVSCVSPTTLTHAGLTLVSGDQVSVGDLDAVDAVLTESALGIAETGTIVLQSVPGQGPRSWSLVPDRHLCVVRAASVLTTVPEAIERLQETAHLPTTFISGPSATADIEMTRIKGVHGPRTLIVLLVN